jgi:hypothetical protein
MGDLDELQKKAAELVKMMERVQNETDPEKFIAIAKEIEAAAKQFERLGEAYTQEARKQVRPMTTVVLTPEQRKRIQAKTGVDLDSVELPDDAAMMSKVMPMTRAEMVEYWATQEAKRRKQAADAGRQAMGAVHQAIAELEAVNNPQLMEQLEELKKDPNFLGGMLSKKK